MAGEEASFSFRGMQPCDQFHVYQPVQNALTRYRCNRAAPRPSKDSAPLRRAAVLGREQSDKAVDAVVADLLGECAAVVRGQADAVHPDVEDLPAGVGLLEV